MIVTGRKKKGLKVLPLAVSLNVARPKCMYCGYSWLPPEGVVASDAYCPCCSASRRRLASAAFGLAPLTMQDASGPYLLPRALRSIQEKVK